MNTYIHTKSYAMISNQDALFYGMVFCIGVFTFFLTPHLYTEPQCIKTLIISSILILFAIISYRVRLKKQLFFLGLCIICLGELVTYNVMLHQRSDLFKNPMPKRFLVAQKLHYQNTREAPYEDRYFQVKELGALYAITSMYLQKDFCPSPRQDVVDKNLYQLLTLRNNRKNMARAYRKNIGLVDYEVCRHAIGGAEYDKILRQVLGFETPKIRFVQQAYETMSIEDAISKIATSDDIYHAPIILTNSATSLTFEKKNNPFSQNDILVKYFSDNQMILRVKNQARHALWLVYADAFNPYWQAFVDKKLTPIYSANLAFKAIKIDPGSHEVHFKYNRPHLLLIIFALIMISIGVLSMAFLFYFASV